MNEDTIKNLISEIREEYHIPPFTSDNRLKVLIEQSNQYLCSLVSDIDYTKDLIAKGLLKNRVFYAHNNKTNEFYPDYCSDLLHWQFSKLEDEADENANV